jgi:RNA polymerase sigma factor (sigma-70 family)
LTKNPSDQHFAAVVMPHLDDAYALAHWLAGNSADAEDIVQEACLRALRGLDRYAGGNAGAWLLTITRNTAFTWLARNRPKALVVTEDIEALAPADGAPTKPTPRRLSSRSVLCPRHLRKPSCCATLMD